MWPRTVVAILALVSTANAGDAWTVKGDSDQRVVEATGTAQIGERHVDAFFSLTCNRTGAPVAWLDFTIADADEIMQAFDLSPFEGPDAPAQARQLVTIELLDGKALATLRAHASGWYSAEHAGGFGFGVGGRPAESAALSKLIKRATRAGTVLRIRIASFRKSPHSIVAEFPLTGARDALSRLATSCR